MQDILRKIGLTNKEIEVFLVLLEYGARPASFIAQKSGVNRATAYSVLRTLIRKNLAYQTIKADIVQFSAHHPDKLLEYLDAQSHQLNNLKSEVEGILPDLENLEAKIETWKPRFRYFEGRESMQDLFRQVINTKDKQLHAFISMMDIDEVFGRDYFEAEVQKRIARDIWLQVIRSKKKEVDEARWPGTKEQKRDLRYLPSNIPAPDMTFYLWDGNKCAFFASKKESYGLLIESPDFYQTQKVMWDNLWNVSREP